MSSLTLGRETCVRSAEDEMPDSSAAVKRLNTAEAWLLVSSVASTAAGL